MNLDTCTVQVVNITTRLLPLFASYQKSAGMMIVRAEVLKSLRSAAGNNY